MLEVDVSGVSFSDSGYDLFSDEVRHRDAVVWMSELEVDLFSVDFYGMAAAAGIAAVAPVQDDNSHLDPVVFAPNAPAAIRPAKSYVASFFIPSAFAQHPDSHGRYLRPAAIARLKDLGPCSVPFP